MKYSVAQVNVNSLVHTRIYRLESYLIDPSVELFACYSYYLWKTCSGYFACIIFVR
jgi:hypothetical protein